jgi:hypothetical protein
MANSFADEYIPSTKTETTTVTSLITISSHKGASDITVLPLDSSTPISISLPLSNIDCNDTPLCTVDSSPLSNNSKLPVIHGQITLCLKEE